MQNITRITRNPEVMGGKPCIRGMRVTVGTIIGLMASGHSNSNIIKAYPYLEEADIYEALAYAAWRVMIPIALAIKIAATQTKSACAD
jgi:uncharacterized protein (DUF433 family)